MRRISSIRSGREADLENRREELRDIRWKRHRSQLGVLIGLAIALSGTATDVVRMFLRMAGQ